MSDVSTIKLPRVLRDRIVAGAASGRVALADFLDRLLARHHRERRLAAVGRAYGAEHDADYRQLTDEWGETSTDGRSGPRW
jgi:hypothetical protein